jgi:HAD superfamily hydrolase (TIGR01509 family)
MIRAIIFDMDGVLIDAREWHYEALNKALGLFGYEIGRQAHLSRFDGLPTRRKLDMLSEETGLPRELHSLINEMKQTYTMELVSRHCRPVFQHRYALAKLKEAGYLLAVASNAIRASVDGMMTKADLARFLDASVSNEDVTRAKPDPEIYLNTCELLGVDPHEAVVIEDAEYGAQAAQRAGTHVLRVEGVEDVTLAAILQFVSEVERSRHRVHSY